MTNPLQSNIIPLYIPLCPAISHHNIQSHIIQSDTIPHQSTPYNPTSFHPIISFHIISNATPYNDQSHAIQHNPNHPIISHHIQSRTIQPHTIPPRPILSAPDGALSLSSARARLRAASSLSLPMRAALTGIRRRVRSLSGRGRPPPGNVSLFLIRSVTGYGVRGAGCGVWRAARHRLGMFDTGRGAGGEVRGTVACGSAGRGLVLTVCWCIL